MLLTVHFQVAALIKYILKINEFNELIMSYFVIRFRFLFLDTLFLLPFLLGFDHCRPHSWRFFRLLFWFDSITVRLALDFVQ